MDIENCNFIDDKGKLTTVFSLGKRLRQARESMGWSQKKIADSLCLKLRIIKSIEEDHIDTLNLSSTFVYGYVTSYARLVNINDEDMMKLLVCMFSSVGVVNTKKQSWILYFLNGCRKNIRLLFFVFFVFFVLVLIIWYLRYCIFNDRYFDVLHSDIVIHPFIFEGNKKYLSSFFVGGFLEKKSMDIFFDDKCNYINNNVFMYKKSLFSSLYFYIPEVLDKFLNRIDYNMFGKIFFEEINCNVDSNVNNIHFMNCDSNLLVIKFSSDCWIEVLDGNGKRLYVGTQHSGDVLNLQGEVPYNLVIGAPKFLTITYCDTIVDLNRFIHPYKVTRLTIPF